jgi:hypothetical protein
MESIFKKIDKIKVELHLKQEIHWTDTNHNKINMTVLSVVSNIQFHQNFFSSFRLKYVNR